MSNSNYHLQSPPSMSDNKDEVDLLKHQHRVLQRSFDQLIENANSNQKTQERFQKLELYFLMANSFEELLKRILIDIKDQFRVDEVQLYLCDPQQEIKQLLTEVYDEIAQSGLNFIYAVDHICYPELELKVPLNSTKLLQFSNGIQNPQAIGNPLFYSAAFLPLKRANQHIGQLHLFSKDKSRFKPNLATHFLDHMSSIISVCIDNSINQERYKHLSLVDMLTRVKNRRYFFQALSKEIARATRAKQPIACLFLDIDHFKQINDQYGHSIGDKALKHIAKAIQTQLRRSDVLARFGGEEFTVLLPNTKLNDSLEIAERIRLTVQNSPLLIDEKNTLNITTSIGLGTCHPAQDKAHIQEIQHKLIHQADSSVYHAKKSGRNCVKHLKD